MTLGVKTVYFRCIIIHVIFDVSLHVYHGGGATHDKKGSNGASYDSAAIWRCNCVSSFALTLNGKVSLQQRGADQMPRQLLLCEPFCNLISVTTFHAAIVNGFDPPNVTRPYFPPRTKVGMEIGTGYEGRLVKPVQGHISACCPLCTVHQSL